jgi:peroxiredoxin
VAISVDSPEESGSLCRSQGYTFPFLSDPRAEAIRAYGVLHEHAGEGGKDIARPAEFLVDRDGIVQYVNLTESIITRLRPNRVLRVIDSDAHAR